MSLFKLCMSYISVTWETKSLVQTPPIEKHYKEVFQFIGDHVGFVDPIN